MNRLKTLDKVAYVRFASVYLEFEDVSEFMTELKYLVRSRDKITSKKSKSKKAKSNKKQRREFLLANLQAVADRYFVLTNHRIFALSPLFF